MATLLLTFFVLLISLARVQDPGLFNRGRGAFVESVRGFGLGALYGRKQGCDFGEEKIEYFIDSREDLSSRTIDAKEEEIRRLFNKVGRMVTAIPSQIVAESTDFSVTNIRFAPGDATLDGPAKKFLTAFCADLQQGVDLITGTVPGGSPPFHGGPAGILYVLGLADDEKSEKQQWMLSAQRAQAVAQSLQSRLVRAEASGPGFEAGWQIYWWGAGPGGDWVARDSPISRNCQILIAVLRPGG
jgi:outer membrane protein OmpA-like peptidoglycan-associated protein